MARRSKRNRQGGGQPPPPYPFPEGPPGFRLRFLNAKEADQDPDAYFVVESSSTARKIGQFCRHLPADLVNRAEWIQKHLPIKQDKVPDEWCADLWHGLHNTWQYHRQHGIQGFLTEQIEMMGGLEEIRKLGGLWLSAQPLPEGRRVIKFPTPHIVLILEPDGEFCRIKATEFWGPVAIGVRAEREMPEILGPVSVGVVGTVLVDGKDTPDPKGQEPCLMLIDPLTVVGDFGPVDHIRDDGVNMYSYKGNTEKLYHPNDDIARDVMPDTLKRFMDMWDGPVPGFAGRIGKLKRQIAAGEEKEKKEREKIPTNPAYMEALERQLQTARFVHDQRPFETIRRDMRLPANPVDYDAIAADALESASTFYWTPMMCNLLGKSFPTLPQWFLRPQEVGARRGYCWFAEPVTIVEGDPEKLRALLWFSEVSNTGNRTYAFVPFTIYSGPGAELVMATFSDLYFGAPRHMMAWTEGQSLTDWLVEEGERFRPSAAIYETMAGTNEKLVMQQRLAWGRIFATTVSIMSQTLIKLAPYGPDRSARKRIERLRPPGLEPPHPLVRAVLLRRQYTVRPGIRPDSEPVDWSCQWVVHEHWRQQFYPSLGEHKWILIADHIKGPPHKPLKDPLPLGIVMR